MKHQRILGVAVVTGLAAACGSAKEPFSLSPSGGKKATSAPSTAFGSDATAASTSSFHFTASYSQRPVDVLIIRDGGSHDYLIDQRMKAALPLLAARLWNLGAQVGSVHVAVLDQDYQSNDPKVPPVPAPGTPIQDAKVGDLVLATETYGAAAFDAALEARLDTAGTRGGQPRPATVLMAGIAEAAKPGGGTMSGIFRPNAYLSVLYLTAEINPDDPYDAQDIADALKGKTSGFSVSALTLPKEDCTFVGDTSQKPQETNPDKSPQRNLELKLAALTDGVTGSVCDKTYALFMDDYGKDGTGSAYFEVQLPTSVRADSIVITADPGIPIKSFKYVPGQKTLDVSTIIASGQGFTVVAAPDTAAGAAVVAKDPGDNVPQAGQSTLPPDQQQFLTTVNPVFQRDCSGCHNGRPFDTSGGYAAAMANKAEIARRVQLPAADPQHMPQNGTLAAGDLATVVGWATK